MNSIIFLISACPSESTWSLAKNTSVCHFLRTPSLFPATEETSTGPVQEEDRRASGDEQENPDEGQERGGQDGREAKNTDARPKIALVRKEPRSMLLALAMAVSSFESMNSLLSNAPVFCSYFAF